MNELVRRLATQRNLSSVSIFVTVLQVVQKADVGMHSDGFLNLAYGLFATFVQAVVSLLVSNKTVADCFNNLLQPDTCQVATNMFVATWLLLHEIKGLL